MRIRKTAAVLLLAAFTVAGSIRSVARHYLFPNHEVPFAAPPASVEHWVFRATDGETVHALAVSGGRHGRVVVHFHNNRETMVDSLWLARGLAERGLDVVLAEYRGYGVSRPSAEPTEDGLYRDAEATLDELARRGYGPERVVLWGTSLGSGVAAEMARRHRGAALVLVSRTLRFQICERARIRLAPGTIIARPLRHRLES